MNNKTILKAFFDEVKANLNASLTKPIKTFVNGFSNLETIQDPSLLFVVNSALVSRGSTSREISTVSASFIVKISKSLDPQGDLLGMVDEIQEFVFERPHLGGVTMASFDKWEMDTLEQGQAGILAIDLELII